MEINLLRAFIAVAEEGHFGRAASRLFLSPPAVTYRIQQLERQVGVSLLRRSPVELTEAGSALLPHAYETIRHSDAALASVLPYLGGQAGRLRIGIMSHGAGALTHQIIETFFAACPDVSISVHSIDFTEHISALVDGHVDISFVRPRLGDDQLREVVLTEEARVAVLPASDDRAELEELSVADLADDTFIDIPEEAPDSYAGFLFLSADRNLEAPRRSPYRGRTAEGLLTGVAAGFGITTTLESFPEYYPWRGVRYIPLADATVANTTLVYRGNDASPLTAAFVAAGHAVLSKPETPSQAHAAHPVIAT